MSATRSGTIYSKVSKTNVEPVGKTNAKPASISIPKTPENIPSTPILRSNNIRPAFFEPVPSPIRSTRPNRTQLSPEVLRDLCAESDNDSTSSYDSDDVEEEQKLLLQYQYMPPKYEVNIDFDEASKAWRENKRRVGESWVYKKEKSERKNASNKIKTKTKPEFSVTSRLVLRSSTRR